jgi:hypothetical protein
MRKTATALGLVLGLLAACSANDATPPNPVRGEAVYAYPFDTLEDWVSYGDVVVIGKVTGEERIPPGPENADQVARGEGVTIERRLSVEVQRVIWRHPSAQDPPAVFDFGTSGWVLKDHREVPFTTEGQPRLEVGGRYLMPIVFTGEAPYVVGRGAFPVDDTDHVSAGADDDFAAELADGSDGQEWILELAEVQFAGLSADDVAAKLSATPPDPVAEANRNLPARERSQAVVAAENP